MIAAVATIKDEADIIGATVGHMLAQGVDRVWVMDWQSTDGTREILADIENVTLVDGSPLPFYWVRQGSYIQRLADMAGEQGAEWIVPFDADEYWTGTHGRTVAESLTATSCDRVQANIAQYVDFDHKSLHPYPWTKVAYRYRPAVAVWAGNHGVNGRWTIDDDALLVHELKFRGFDHFSWKHNRWCHIPWGPDGARQPGADGVVHTEDDEVRWNGTNGFAMAGEEPQYFRIQTPEEQEFYWKWWMDAAEDGSIPSKFRPVKFSAP